MGRRARATRSTIPGAIEHQRLRPRQSPATATSGWSAATSTDYGIARSGERLPLRGDDRRPRATPATTGRSTIPARSSTTSTARWAASPSATTTAPPTTARAACRSARATPSSTTSPATRSSPTSSSPARMSNTAYGIWYNGGTSYTICGGYSLDPVNNFDDPEPADRPGLPGRLRLRDRHCSRTGSRSTTRTATNFVTHFEGISSVEKGVYTLNADSVQSRHGRSRARLVGDRPPQRRRLVRRRGVGRPQLSRRRSRHQRHQLQLGVRQSGGRHRRSARRHVLVTRRRSTPASSCRT